MQKKQKKPLVLTLDRVKVLAATDLDKVEGGTGIPPKLSAVGIGRLRNLGF